MFPLDFPTSTNISTPSLETAELEDFLTNLKQVHQVDLQGYRRSTLMRRISIRMQEVEVEKYQDYIDYLEQEPEELVHLLDTFFINFTQFFRDPPVWDYLANQIIPQLIANKEPNDPIRVWSAGCASGEETYSLAMLLAEALGIEQFQQRVRLYGTDIAPDAVRQARKGFYPAHAVDEAIPSALQEQYFERKTDGYLWRTDLRRSMTFLCHDLTQAPPFPRIDLLVCRNTLMYFIQQSQIQALVRFHFSLRNYGFLLLGKTESIVGNPQALLFKPVTQRLTGDGFSDSRLQAQYTRIFTKVPDAHRNSKLLAIAFS